MNTLTLVALRSGAATPAQTPFVSEAVGEEYIIAGLLAAAGLFFWSAPRVLQAWRTRA